MVRHYSMIGATKDRCRWIDGLSWYRFEKYGNSAFDRESVLNVQGFFVLVGCGTDSASINVGRCNGMKMKLQAVLPLLHWSWCFTYWLKLACYYEFSSQLFNDIVETILFVQETLSVTPDGGSLPV